MTATPEPPPETGFHEAPEVPRLLAGMIPKRLAETFLARWLVTTANKWVRTGIIASFAIGFTVPYFRLLNEIQVEGDEIFETLPRKNVIFLANHQTYFLEAIAFFDLVYLRHHMPLENPVLRVSAAEETMRPFTTIMRLAGAVTLKRRYRSAGKPVNRPPDLEGIARVEEAARTGWLLHFPAGTTREGAELRPGVARILHNTKAVVVPVHVDGFRRMLLLRQVPGKLFRSCSIRLYPPMDLGGFYGAPYSDERADDVLRQLDALIHPKA